MVVALAPVFNLSTWEVDLWEFEAILVYRVSGQPELLKRETLCMCGGGCAFWEQYGQNLQVWDGARSY